MRQRSEGLRTRLEGLSRNQLIFRGIAGFLASAMVLLSGLWAISALGGITLGGLTHLGWLGVLLIGLAFVHIQVVSAAAMIVVIQKQGPT